VTATHPSTKLRTASLISRPDGEYVFVRPLRGGSRRDAAR
jgi:hypothetical protein